MLPRLPTTRRTRWESFRPSRNGMKSTRTTAFLPSALVNFCFEDQRVVRVAAADFDVGSDGRRCDRPTAMVRVAKQFGKTCCRVEAGPAEPVDGAAFGDER